MKKVSVNLVYNALYQFLLVALPILTIPYLSRTFSTENVGINGYVGSIVAFAGNFMLLGLNQYGVRTIAQAKAEELEDKFRDLWIVQITAGLIILIIYSVLVLFFLPYRFYFLLNIPYLIGYGLDISWAYIGRGNVSKVVLRNSVIKISTVILIFTLIHSSGDLWKYMVINSVGMLIANLIFLIDLKSLGIRLKSIRWQTANFRYLKPLLFLAIPVVSAQLYTNVDSTIVGTIAGATQLAYYDQSQKMARIVLAILTSISTVIMPKMAQLDREGSDDKLLKMFKASADYTLMLAFFFALILMINAKSFIIFFYSKKFIPMTFNMFWVSLIIIFVAYGGVFATQLALAKGLYREYMIPYVVGAVFSVTANIPIAKVYGANGGTVVIVLTELLVCFLRIFFVRNSVDLKTLFSEHIKYLFAFLVVLLGSRFVQIGQIGTFTNLAITSIIGAIAYFVILLLLRTRFFSDIHVFLKKRRAH
ncbi:oligosaccharide flippase family protein [Lapidilactobacillus luobeiensis]|uniref:oligosaccharide flippase family protein n=1 Tax=Lapidilactobacillus luobeiensis TaxID=2950371 RepID=UPI0021C2E62D|nr:oligosaccharide flippase family protein [Lapidilactobacillus luobeiensis]